MLHLLRQPDRIARWFLLAALVFLLAACGAATPAMTEAPPAGAIEATFTPPPTPEPTSLPAKVILTSDAGSSPAELQRVETRLAALAAAGNSTLVRQESVTAADLTDDVKVVVWVGTAAGIADLAAGAPRVQFVAITPAEVQPLDNLSIIRSQPENAVFIAGYISTLIAPDWRGGALLPSDGPLGGQAQSIFTNGGRFFCGRCAPAYAPIVLFPVSAALPTGSPASAWTAAFSELNQNVIEVLYVSDAAASPELLTSLGRDRHHPAGEPAAFAGMEPELGRHRAGGRRRAIGNTLAGPAGRKRRSIAVRAGHIERYQPRKTVARSPGTGGKDDRRFASRPGRSL
jgi:hypothetical protein